MDLLRLEQQRQALDDSLEQLRQNLRMWQTWEAEYEGLKEEIRAIGSGASLEQLTQVAETYGGDLVNETEIRDLLGLPKGSPRSADQVVGVIERRQEYVQKNIETVQRQFFDAEAKQEELAFAVANYGTDGVDAARGLPLTEILEELDEDDNVISSQLSRPEEATAKVVETLRKAGLTEDDLKVPPSGKTTPEELKPAIVNNAPLQTPAVANSAHAGSAQSPDACESGQDELERPSIRKKSVSFTADTKAAPERPRQESEDGRKSVSFAEKVAVMPAAPPPDTRSVSFSPQVEEIPAPSVTPQSPAVDNDTQTRTVLVQTDPARQKELRQAYKPGDKVVQLNDDDEIESVQVVMPDNESPEDAAIRRELLEYHLNEVGNIVAELDLEEANAGTSDVEDDEHGDDERENDDVSSFYTTSERADDEDTPYTTGLSESDDGEEEDEDEYGRSTRRLVSSDYRKEMMDLEQRIIGNLGPRPELTDVKDVDPELNPADVHRLVIRDKRNSVSSTTSEDSSEKQASRKKRVSFAESIDVAHPASPPLKAQKHQQGENVAPVSDVVAERTTAASHSVPGTSGATKVSRFKKSRAAPIADPDDEPILSEPVVDLIEGDTEDGSALADDIPTGPPGRTLADTLTERIPTHTFTVAPSADDPDPIAERRLLAAEYYRRRNDIIRQQGGFQATPDEDDMYGELMEERDGKLKKVSRFKAARIKPQ